MTTPTPKGFVAIDEETRRLSASLATEGLHTPSSFPQFRSSPFWAGLKAMGTELWLDTADPAEAQELWTQEFSGFTVNNSLLNTEVQKGTYDAVITRAATKLAHLDRETRVREVAFILSARHGLSLVASFGARVSVELHPDLAEDVENSVEYARRLHALSPDRFLIKIPFTAAGLIAAHHLAEANIPINLTLGFSARQSYLAAVFSRPSFVNVFLGRLNAYVAEAKVGSGALIGERATVAAQKAIHHANEISGGGTRQIAASLRNPAQVAALAGVDVQTIPPKVARGTTQELNGWWEWCLDKDYMPQLAAEVDPNRVRIETLWDISPQLVELTRKIAESPPLSAQEMRERAETLGIPDLFPIFTDEEQNWVRTEGKIPSHARWEQRISRGEVAIDSLLSAAGLAAFAHDQQALDDRILSLAESR